MKRLFLLLSSTLLLARVAMATDEFYINNGIVSVTSPPQAAYHIDATTFLNYNYFAITNFNLGGLAPVLPYQTQNTLNYTNFSLMLGDTGFNFDCYDSSLSRHRMAANFVNFTTINPANATILGTTYLLVSATNITDRGVLAIGDPGLLKLSGHNVDLSRGVLAGLRNDRSDLFGISDLAGIRDVYWGAATNLFFGAVDPTSFFSPLPVTTILGQFTGTTFQFFQMTNGFNTYMKRTFTSPTNAVLDVLFCNTNPAVSTEVRFGSTSFRGWGSPKFIQWQGVVTNRATGVVSTNFLYLSDTLSSYGDPFPDPNPPAPRLPESWLRQTPAPLPFYGLFGAARFCPVNYSLTRAFRYFTNYALMTPVTFDPAIYDGFYAPQYVTNTAYAAGITAQAYSPDSSITGSTFSNVPGRFEITADHVLDLTRVHMDGQSYLLLKATNHFVGSTNAEINSAISDIHLATTNASMTIANLTTPTVPRMSGLIQVWSGRWTNIDFFGIATTYNVSVVDSQLAPEQPSQIQDLSLRSPELVIRDRLNVFRSLCLDTERLTVTTNAPGAPTLCGEINLTSGDLLWAPSLPRLRCLTNFGKITTANSAFFGGARRPPWFSGVFNEPYQTFVNHGLVASQGAQIWADYLESDGLINAVGGPLSLTATHASFNNSSLIATNADLSISSGFLLVSNQFLCAGRAINLSVTDLLSDGIPNIATLEPARQLAAAVTNGNGWQSTYGLSLSVKPARGDLLGTTITNFAAAYSEVPIVWAGADRGLFDPADTNSSGFLNNAALGRLLLDGQTNSLFTFSGVADNNALYVDCLDFRNWTGAKVLENSDDPTSLNHILQVAPNFKVYYAQALVNGVSVAEKLSQLGIGFIWVSNYNYGYFSSTNILYDNGETYRLNAALAASCDLVSNTNLPPVVNCQNPYPGPIWPIPVWSPATNNVFVPPGPFFAPRILAQPENICANLGASIVLNVAAEGSEPLAFQWRKDQINISNGDRVSGANSPHLAFASVLELDAAGYDVVVSNPYGAVTSSVAVVTVSLPPVDPLAPPRLGFPPSAASNSVFKAFGSDSYVGLFSDTNGVSAASSGFLTAKTTTRGTYSGKLTLAGRTYSFSGFFSPSSGQSGTTISRGPNLRPLSLLLHREQSDGDQMRGHISADTWTAEVLAYRQAFNKSTRPAGMAGKYTLLIPPDVGGPGGYGFGTLTVDAKGTLRWSGALADGTKVSQATAVSSEGMWPLHASLYRGAGCLLGWMQFAPGLTNSLGGQCLWLRPATFNNKYSPQASTNEVEALGSAYLQAPTRLLPLNSGNGLLTLSGGGLALPSSTAFSLDLRNRFILPRNSSLKLKLKASSGLFSGSALLPLGKASFQGVLFQDGNFGAGFFLAPNQCGEVNLSPAP